MSAITDKAHVLAAVSHERSKQDLKWGVQNHHPDLWMCILMEEVGEAAKAAFENKPDELRKELIQVAAVAVAIIEAMERAIANQNKKGPNNG